MSIERPFLHLSLNEPNPIAPMQDYRHVEPEALAADPSFQRWQLFQNPDDSVFWNEWVQQNPDKEKLIERAVYLLKTISSAYQPRLGAEAHLTDEEVQVEIRQLHRAIQETDDRPVRWFQLTPVRYGMAASLLILLGLFGWNLYGPVQEKQPVTYQELVASAVNPLSEVVNVTRKTVQINLPDRSTVTLYPKSRVSYDKRFAGLKREVYLSGKAYFNVTKDPSKPFYVYAANLVTKVLGTSFIVQAYEGDRQMKVVVRTGRVSVSTPNREGVVSPKGTGPVADVVLTPNQQIIVSSTETRLVKTAKSLIAEPVQLDLTTQKQPLTFKRTPIADVFAALGQSYGIKIIFDEEVMKNCYLTASLADEPLFDKLDLVCRTINAHYEQVDGSVVIASKGCN